MRAMMPREAFGDLDEFLARWGAPMFGRWPRLSAESQEQALEWAPMADITETETEYVVKADLPGVKKEDVQVQVEGNIIAITGERRQEKEEKGEKRRRVERSYGAFYRSFTLPEDAATGDIRAVCKEGVLSVHIPRVKTVKPKAVAIKVQ